MQFNILTIFPKIIKDYIGESILKRGQEAGAITISSVDIRDFATNKHNTIDDSPYGGGAGMVMQAPPIHAALDSVKALKNNKDEKTHTILLSPRGREFTQDVAQEFAEKYDRIVMVCGRYEGVDQRITDNCVDEEISVGKYVLAGGELGALIITEATARLVPGVLGNADSLKDESFGKIKKEYPQYTRPEEFSGWKVPEILLSGNHAEIEKWREESAE